MQSKLANFRGVSLVIALAGSLCASLVGCGSADETPQTQSVVKTQEGDQSKGDNVNSKAQEVHDPAQIQNGGGYRITPPDPNDKRFKPDPKLGGGG